MKDVKAVYILPSQRGKTKREAKVSKEFLRFLSHSPMFLLQSVFSLSDGFVLLVLFTATKCSPLLIPMCVCVFDQCMKEKRQHSLLQISHSCIQRQL